MFCTNCGKELSDEAIVCTHCGVPTKNFSGANHQPEHKQGNGMAVAGFVCSFFIPILGWVFGGIGLARSNKRGGKGKGLSVAALVIATMVFFVSLAMY